MVWSNRFIARTEKGHPSWVALLPAHVTSHRLGVPESSSRSMGNEKWCSLCPARPSQSDGRSRAETLKGRGRRGGSGSPCEKPRESQDFRRQPAAMGGDTWYNAPPPPARHQRWSGVPNARSWGRVRDREGARGCCNPSESHPPPFPGPGSWGSRRRRSGAPLRPRCRGVPTRPAPTRGTPRPQPARDRSWPAPDSR